MDRGEITIRIIRPASREKTSILTARIEQLEKSGFRVLYDERPLDASWPFTAASVEARAASLTDALRDDATDAILCARGGYGASDLLPLIPWSDLARCRAKPLVGFSDVSALHSALHSLLGWPAIHGPMPATDYWGAEGFTDDIEAMLGLLTGPVAHGRLAITRSFQAPTAPVDGWLFGGCLSVLTTLIGTPYFPASLNGAILFFEDIGENPARIIRFVNQWQQSGALTGVRGIVLGRLIDCDDPDGLADGRIAREIAKRTKLPVWESPDFGHCSPNFPILLNANATIRSDALTWAAKERRS